jgi:hypothetical protein
MNKKLLIVGAVLLFCILTVSVKIFLFNSSSSDKEVLKFARDMNRYCPQMVDVETRLDNVNALTDNVLQFNYTLINRDRDSVPLGKLKKFMEPVILDKIRTSPILSRYTKKDLTWVYSYNDRNGDFMFKLSYTREQLK